MQIIWWILGILLGLIAGFFLLLTVSALLVDPKRDYDKTSRFYRFVINLIAAVSVGASNVRVHVSGREKIPREGRFLLVGNHRSNYDPFVTLYALRHYELSFLSKPENFGVIFVGRIIRKCCFMPIDRENPRAALKAVERATRLVRAGEVSIGVYPEGTRSKGGALLPFHSSVFKIAQWGQVPIVIAVLQGTEQVRRRFPRRTDVTLDIVGVLSVEEQRGKRSQEISDSVRAAILDALGEEDEAAPV